MRYRSLVLWLLVCSMGGHCLLPQKATAESVILWWEAEDAIDYTFPHGLIPSYMEVLAEENELSNRLGLQIATQAPPWHERGYFVRYEVWIPHSATYTLYVREAYFDGVFAPARWRFDTHMAWYTNQWATSTVLDRRQGTIGNHDKAARIDGGWVKYGEVTLTAGAHTLDLEALPDVTGRYAKLLDALVLATGPFTPTGKTPPPKTSFMHDLLASQPVQVVLDPTAVVRAQMPRVHRGIALYSLGDSLVGKEIYITAMKALGVNLSRLFRYHSSLYPMPRLDSSPQWPQLQTFLERRRLPSDTQRLLDYFTGKDGKGLEAERVVQLRALLHFLETKGISFTQPYGDTWDSTIQTYLAVRDFGGVHLISHSLRFPRWLSSKPTSDTLQNFGVERRPLYEVFLPTVLRGYTALWKQDIETLTRRVPGLVTYWEVHNEPDADEFLRVPSAAPPETPLYRKQLVDSYIRLYDAAAQAVREARVTLQLGGTSSHVLPEDPIIPRLIEHAQQTRQKLDFLSWHAYGTQPIDVKNAIKTVQALLRKAGLPQVKLLIDEWNLYGTGGWTKAQADLFNSHFNAAISAASLGAMIEADLDRAVFFYDRDQSPHPKGLHFGLLTHDNRKKPVYFTFLMFERLGDTQIHLAFSSRYKVGGLATQRTDGTIVLLLWNYDLSQRVSRQIRLHLADNRPLVYDRYLIDAYHTQLGAHVMDQVASNAQDKTFTMSPNSVTLLFCRTGE